MSQLPMGWIEQKIKNINERKSATINPAHFPDETFELFSVPIFPTGNAELLQGKEIGSTKQLVEAGDVLLCKINPRINRVWVVTEPKGFRQIASSEWIVISSSVHDSDFLKYYFRENKFRGLLCSDVSGVGGSLTRAKPKLVNEYNVIVAPLAEQTRIVEKLDEVLAQVDTIKARLDGIPAILKRFRQSVLAAAVSGKLTEEWRGKNVSGCAESELNANFSRKSGKLKLRGKQANLNELSLLTLPSSWTWTQNYKLAKDASNAICAGPFGTIFKAKDFRDEGVPIIFLRHVKEDGFNQHKPNYMDRAVWEELHQEYSVHGGELLVTKLGDPPGECCIYPENTGTSMVTPDVLKMDVDEQSAEKKYLRSYFNSPISTEIIEKLAFGATRLRIDIAMFKAFPVPLPPMEEQKEIVRLVDQYFAFADTIEAQVKKAQARVDKLTQSILAKAFRGELVPQDPNDEPADKLLERIAAARKEAEVLAKAAKKAAQK
ncbi:restriction endonuclease subunit S [Vibrio cholerae]|uniref:restriction endonuclease subunit S n=1 Tax=Vibrio cholerae TaxID=666 RepID=UPI0011D832F0|nr:restriction endonuclease subunit S [Vibrio cholerae]EGR0310166.1 restriction endonuclease subunit S [Vibrio cholerae]EGR2538343.1 restriction endonuclease subunit S [Vibrio cholerae]TXZ64703.1 restriction endonuclease subunit S [Vibrio cholerae]GIB36917.1 Type I restriction enzyme EcoKI, S subunit [Vibrio cholerae]